MLCFPVSHSRLYEIFQLRSYTPIFIVCPHLCPSHPGNLFMKPSGWSLKATVRAALTLTTSSSLCGQKQLLVVGLVWFGFVSAEEISKA